MITITDTDKYTKWTFSTEKITFSVKQWKIQEIFEGENIRLPECSILGIYDAVFKYPINEYTFDFLVDNKPDPENAPSRIDQFYFDLMGQVLAKY